jgi:hypothetical protein
MTGPGLAPSPAGAGSPSIPPAGDQMVDQQQDRRPGDGGQPGGEVEEPVQGDDAEQGSPRALDACASRGQPPLEDHDRDEAAAARRRVTG